MTWRAAVVAAMVSTTVCECRVRHSHSLRSDAHLCCVDVSAVHAPPADVRARCWCEQLAVGLAATVPPPRAADAALHSTLYVVPLGDFVETWSWRWLRAMNSAAQHGDSLHRSVWFARPTVRRVCRCMVTRVVWRALRATNDVVASATPRC